MRFLGRRIYFGFVVLLVAALRGGATPVRIRRLSVDTGASFDTISRWIAWWRQSFPATAFWKARHGDFVPTIEIGSLPGSLLERFTALDPVRRIVQALCFLAPLSTSSAYPELAF